MLVKMNGHYYFDGVEITKDEYESIKNKIIIEHKDKEDEN